MNDPIAALAEITERNPEECRALMEAAGGNLDAAIALHFDSGFPDRSPNLQPQAETPNQSYRPYSQPMQHQSLMEELNQDLVSETAPRILPTPVVVQARRWSFLWLLLSPLWGFRQLCAAVLGYVKAGSSQPSTRNSLEFNATLQARRHKEWLEKLSGEPLNWLWADGGYLAALEHSKQHLKNLIIVLTSRVHEDTPHFVKVVFPELATLSQRGDTLIWSASVQDSEGYQLALKFSFTALPLVVLVAPSPKTPQSSTIVMATLSRISAPHDGRQLVLKLDEEIESHAPKLVALRLDRERANTDRLLREEQDSAYQRSLETDRRRENDRRAQNDRAANLERWKRSRYVFFNGPVESGSGRILLRLPDGKRVVHSFAANSTVRDVYDYIYAVHLHPPVNTSTSQVISQIEVERPAVEYDFSVISPILRKTIEPSDALLSSESAFWPNGSLVVDQEHI